MKVSAKESGKSKSKCKIFYQNFKCKTFYINLTGLICLTENILLENKHCKIRKYFLKNILHQNKWSISLITEKALKKEYWFHEVLGP